MEKYNGIKDDSLQKGGSYNENAIGHEVCNFSDVDNNVYGYVRSAGQIKIERLGASKKDESISSITVFWTASPESGGTVVIGWYKNATVYREPQAFSKPTKLQKNNGLKHYRIVASAKDATLLTVNKRTLLIPRGVKGGIGQSNVWYAKLPESKKHVVRVKKLLTGEFSDEIVDIDLGGKEGNPRFINHIIRERNPKIVKEKKKQVLEKTGKLCCEVCNFDFKETYGEIGEGFCEVHHLKQLAKADGEVTTKLEDLAIICSNCHRMIHKPNNMLKINQLKKIITRVA